MRHLAIASLLLFGLLTIAQAQDVKPSWTHIRRPQVDVRHWLERPQRRSRSGSLIRHIGEPESFLRIFFDHSPTNKSSSPVVMLRDNPWR